MRYAIPKKPCRFIAKSASPLMRILSRIPGVPPLFMSHFWTTIGHTIYVPTIYDADPDWGRPSWYLRHKWTIAHEQLHAAQVERWTFPGFALMYVGPSVPLAVLTPGGLAYGLSTGAWWPLVLLLVLMTVLLPLTFGLAWGRWRIEREAYMIQLRNFKPVEEELHWTVLSLWSSYGFVWPRRWMRAWFLKELKKEAE